MSSDFQLIAGTVRDLRQLVAEGKFREDLYARINLWTFTLPGLRQRQEDIEPNLDYEVERHASLTGDSVRFNTEARRAWLAFATSPRQHGAVTFANFLPASRGWPPLPLADASHWIRWKMRSTVCAITGRRVALHAYGVAGRRGRKHRSLRPYATGTRYRYLPPGKVAFCCRT